MKENRVPESKREKGIREKSKKKRKRKPGDDLDHRIRSNSMRRCSTPDWIKSDRSISSIEKVAPITRGKP